MPVFDTYWKRQQRLRGELPDVYVYDKMPEPLRVQFVQIMEEILGDKAAYAGQHGYENIRRTYETIVKILRKELGVFHLPHQTNIYHDYREELSDFILKEKDTEQVLSAVELICRAALNTASKYNYRHLNRAEESAEEAVEEINTRLKEHGLGFEYDGEIIRIDSELIHVETVKPALGLLRDSNYSGAEQEFLNAYDHFRKGNNKEALNDALKAFESTMKSIYDARNWTYAKTDPASKLIKVAFDNGLIPSFWENHFGGLRAMLEGGIPTARNKLSGHGQGATPVDVPPHLAAYVLHMTAATIVFLVKAEEALP